MARARKAKKKSLTADPVQTLQAQRELLCMQLEKNVIEAISMLPSPERDMFGARLQSLLEASGVRPGSGEENMVMACVLSSLADQEMRRYLPNPTSREQMLAVAETKPLYALYGCIYTHSALWLKTQVDQLQQVS